MALATMRTRWVSFAGACLAVVLGSGFVTITLTFLSATSVTPFPGPQRFAAAPTVVIPSKTEPITGVNLTVQPPGGLPVALVQRLADTGPIVVDRTFPVHQDGGATGQVGHPWSAAAFTPYRLVAGRPPSTGTDVAIGGGSPTLVGHQVNITTAKGTGAYTVSGVTAPVWFEHAVFFADTTAARISPQIDAVVAYGPPSAVRQAADGSATRVLTGADRKTADPDPSGGKDLLSNTSAAAGTSAALGVLVVVFVVVATFAFVTDQRRRELGLLRVVGASPRQIRRIILTEAVVIGTVSSAAGCALAPLAFSPVTTWTIDHGVAPVWFAIHLTALPLVSAFAIGLVSTVAGSATASWRAARARPVEALRDAAADNRIMPVTRWLLGIGLFAIGAYASVITAVRNPGNAMIVKDYLPAFVPIVAGLALLAPILLEPLARLATWPLSRMGAGPVVVRQAALTARRRTAATAAPIVLALGLAASMLTVETIAKATFLSEMQRHTSAEYVVESTDGTPLSLAAVAAIHGVPHADVTTFTSVHINVATASGAYIDTWDARAVDPATLTATQHLNPTAGSLTHLGGNFLILDERVARMDGLHAGEPVKAYLPDGSGIPLRVAAIISTGVTEATVYIPAGAAEGERPTQAYVAARSDVTPAMVAAALRLALRDDHVQVTPTAQYLEALQSQQTSHDRQATEVILGLALAYALIAVANTSVIAASGRRREIASLSLAGATRRQILLCIAAEAALVAVMGAIMAAVAAVMVLVAQRATLARFAGHAPISIPSIRVAELFAVTIAITVLVSVLTAWRVMRANVIELADLRE